MMRLFVGIALFFTLSASAAEVALLKETQTYKKGTAFVAELSFNTPVEVNKTSVEFINQTVQLNIRGASITTGKEFKKIDDENVKSLFIYQLQPDLMRTRIIYSNKVAAKDLEGYVHISAKDNKLIVTVEDPREVASTDAQKQLPIIPPVDLNAELEPKATSAMDADGLEASATALLEREFLKGKAVKAKTKNEKTTLRQKIKASNSDKSKQQIVEKASTEKLSEEEIPLKLEEVKPEKSDFKLWNRMLYSLAIVSVFGLALVVFAKRYSKSSSKIGGNIKIKVISQQSIGPKKNLTVVRVAGEDILIGVTDYNISMIKSLSFIDDEIESDVPQDFVNELNKVTERYVESRATRRPQQAKALQSDIIDDEFSMGNIKDMISSKLKQMRPL